ncbi:MAG TPA: NRDE family protein [Acetobacteraceae bacterium]|nr:NRDE family protein [Acetobacteraceae bacterium]
MCTLVLLHRPGETWPLLLAANRDELLSRPWQPPAAHWPDQPDVVGGRDTLAGGTWLAWNAAGVVAGVLNRSGSLGPQAGKRSRGDLPLLALRHPAALDAAADLAAEDAGDWRSFNLVIADSYHAFFVRGLGSGPLTVTPLPPGLHMITHNDPNDPETPRVARHLPRFQAAPIPNPPDWSTWPKLLADSEGPREAALCIPETNGFGTASATLIGLSPTARNVLFAAGPPATAEFLRVG